MKDYGVPDEPDGLLPWSWAEERLVRNRNYWVVTASAKGRPHALPVWGVWLPDSSSFAFSCAPTSRKARNMQANPQVVFTVDDTVECISVEGWGCPFFPHPTRPDKQAELATFVKSNAIWQIVPQRAFAVIEREQDFAQRATRWVW